MKILAFDEHLKHREIVEYNPQYRTVFLKLKTHVEQSYPDLELIHVGSSAIPGLSGKTIIVIVSLHQMPKICELFKNNF